ncbi:MAG: hypothetical protein ACOCZ3_01010 [Bacillota bacterium]
MKGKLKYIPLLALIVIFTGTLLPVVAAGTDEGDIPELTRKNQILYSLQVVEVFSSASKRLQLDSLELGEGVEQGDLIFINNTDLLELAGEEWELELSALQEKEQTSIISGPRIAVIPGQTGRLTVTQEELLLDVDSVDSITYENVFELEMTPDSGYDRADKRVVTAVRLDTGIGSTGLETEVLLEPDQPYLLGIVSSNRSRNQRWLGGQGKETEQRSFALYLTAQPVGILTLPRFSGSVFGLERLFGDRESQETENYLRVILAPDSDPGVLSLAGRLQSQKQYELYFSLNDPVSGTHRLGVQGRAWQLLVGGALINTEEEGLQLALTLEDRVELANLELVAGVRPVIYSFDEETDDLEWYFRAMTVVTNPGLELGYSVDSIYEFVETSVGYWFADNRKVLLGYKWDVEDSDNNTFWIGLHLKF